MSRRIRVGVSLGNGLGVVMGRVSAGVGPVFLVLMAVVAASLGLAGSARAAAPALSVSMVHSVDTVQRGDFTRFEVTVTNTGDADTSGPITLTNILPLGLRARELQDYNGNFACPSAGELNAGAAVACTTTATLAPGESRRFDMSVVVAVDAPDSLVNAVSVSGGGAPPATFSDTAIAVVDRPVFDVLDFSARTLDEVGEDYVVAGGHPHEATTFFAFPSYAGLPDPRYPVEDVKNIIIELPPGFVASLASVARCPLTGLQGFFPTCPAGSQVGELGLGVYGNPPNFSGLYNMIPEKGFAAGLGFKSFNQSVITYVRLRSRTAGYGGVAISPGAGRLGITSIAVKVFGVPSARNGAGGPEAPFVSVPGDCLVAAPQTRIIVDSWQRPGRKLDDGSPDLSDARWKTSSSESPPVTGCDRPELVSQFGPGLEARPTPGSGSTQADAPTGLTVDLSFPQTNDATDPSPSFDPAVPMAPALKDAVVTLPEGVAVSPSAADGLDGCSDQADGPGGDQVRLDTVSAARCPEASKIGTVVATSPLLAERDPETDEVTGAEPVSGDVYLVRPHPGDLSTTGEGDGRFRMLISVDSEKYGLHVKIPGLVTADQSTGRLTATVQDNPQLPLRRATFRFFGGDRASLVNPASCGQAKTVAGFTAWSRGGTRSDGVTIAGTPDTSSSSVFEVSWDGKGGACPARLPFSPQLKAGLVDTQAGGSSPFVFDLTREDRNEVINNLNIGLPGGLLAAVKDVTLCSDADAATGGCPTSSRVGSASVAAGSGPKPFYLTGQPVYLTGPYKGAPYGLAVAVHAVAGPFDLGTVVVRQALHVDPDDAHAMVASDPLPIIRDGVPLRVRRIHVTIDRPGFMRTPSGCEAKAITTTLGSPGGQTARLTNGLQASGCERLPFAPKLALKLTGTKEAKVGGHPGVEALFTQRRGEAAVKALAVTLPLSLALDPNNAVSDDLCEYADGLRNQCPQKSVIGTMTAVSPLLKSPLTGKVYFVKGVRTDPKSGRQIRTLPTLLVELRGEVNINLRANSSVPDGKHLTSTFPMIPDAPISSALLRLNGGKKGILVITDGHDDICHTTQTPFLAASAQNGKRLDTRLSLSVECPLAIVSRTYTKTAVKVKLSGIGPGKVTVSGTGIRTTSRTINAATTATITAKLTQAGKRIRKARRNLAIKASYTPKNGSKARTTTK